MRGTRLTTPFSTRRETRLSTPVLEDERDCRLLFPPVGELGCPPRCWKTRETRLTTPFSTRRETRLSTPVLEDRLRDCRLLSRCEGSRRTPHTKIQPDPAVPMLRQGVRQAGTEKPAVCDMSITMRASALPPSSSTPQPPPTPPPSHTLSLAPLVCCHSSCISPTPPSALKALFSVPGTCSASAACPSSRVTSPPVNARAAGGVPRVKGSLMMMKPRQRQPVIRSERSYLL